MFRSRRSLIFPSFGRTEAGVATLVVFFLFRAAFSCQCPQCLHAGRFLFALSLQTEFSAGMDNTMYRLFFLFYICCSAVFSAMAMCNTIFFAFSPSVLAAPRRSQR
eukprot:GEMP01056978.1.p2 GENE.GEMP01056978.1~~GEMP01056978.1.p2  ORF type:complete len:106 (-),score=10.12 GEMP01056978.1:77-394(-)